MSIFTTKPKISTASKLVMYIKFPFLSNVSSNLIKRDIGNFLRRKYCHIDFRFIFVNNFTIKGLLNHKERLPDELGSGIVYSYKCDACGATYVGQSKRSLLARARDHFGISVRTGALLARPSQSAIREHVEVCGSRRSVKDFKVIRSFSCPILLKIYESLEITFSKPTLNQDSSSHPLLLS